MNPFQKSIGRYPIGIWLAFAALCLTGLAWLMQLYSLIDWDGAVNLGLQNDRFTGGDVERTLADVEHGVAIADMIWALPITIVAFIGLLRRKVIGFVAAMMIFAICTYFPLFYLFRASMPKDVAIAAMVLWAVPSLLGIYGLWVNRKIFHIS